MYIDIIIQHQFMYLISCLEIQLLDIVFLTPCIVKHEKCGHAFSFLIIDQQFVLIY